MFANNKTTGDGGENMNQKRKGFTLVELLVVIVIIGILATLATVALGSARVKARDAVRISDIKQVQTALELYYSDEGVYPPAKAGGNSADCDSGDLCFGEEFTGTGTNPPVYMVKVPTDPKSNGDFVASNNGEDACGTATVKKDYYTYTLASDKNIGYIIDYCLGSKVSDIEKGTRCASLRGIDTDWDTTEHPDDDAVNGNCDEAELL